MDLANLGTVIGPGMVGEDRGFLFIYCVKPKQMLLPPITSLHFLHWKGIGVVHL